jgi:hypothetical protein
MKVVENIKQDAETRSKAGQKALSDVAGTPNWSESDTTMRCSRYRARLCERHLSGAVAPEVISLNGASPASDIWSLGCTIIELLTGKPPYSDVSNSMTGESLSQAWVGSS